MRTFRPPPPPTSGNSPARGATEGGNEWQDTRPSQVDELPEPPPRQQPPLQEVLKGLDARELEGQTVFDQLFGDGRPPG